MVPSKLVKGTVANIYYTLEVLLVRVNSPYALQQTNFYAMKNENSAKMAVRAFTVFLTMENSKTTTCS